MQILVTHMVLAEVNSAQQNPTGTFKFKSTAYESNPFNTANVQPPILMGF